MSKKTTTWIAFTGFLVPFMILVHIAIDAVGFLVVLPLILMLVAAALLSQRYVVGRSWHSIMWGDRSDG